MIEAIRKLGWLEGYGEPALGNIYLLGTPIYTLPRLRSWRGRAVFYVASVIALIAALLLHDLTFTPSLVGIVARSPVLYWLCGLAVLVLLLRKKYPWAALELYKAFSRSKELAFE